MANIASASYQGCGLDLDCQGLVRRTDQQFNAYYTIELCTTVSVQLQIFNQKLTKST